MTLEYFRCILMSVLLFLGCEFCDARESPAAQKCCTNFLKPLQEVQWCDRVVGALTVRTGLRELQKVTIVENPQVFEDERKVTRQPKKE